VVGAVTFTLSPLPFPGPPRNWGRRWMERRHRRRHWQRRPPTLPTPRGHSL